MSGQWEFGVVAQSSFSPILRHDLAEHCPAQAGRDLDIAKRGNVQITVGRAEDVSDGAGCVGVEEVLENRRRIRDDDPQEASRASRSSRIKSAAGTPRLMEGLASIRSKMSSAAGLATSRSRISSMKSVSACPRDFARFVSSRWSLSGTLRTWIIFDMRKAWHMRPTCCKQQ